MNEELEFLGEAGRIPNHRPWPRHRVGAEEWLAAADRLAAGSLELLGLWGEPRRMHLALRGATSGEIAVLSFDCPGGTYPSIGRLHPPALRLERMARDLFGLHAEGSPDARPWVDHGWHENGEAAPYVFLPAAGEGLHEVAVGPVHAGVIEPGHFRFTVQGETVVRLEERFGYTHKGAEALMAGSGVEAAALIAARLSGDSTVAFGWVFAAAVESALGVVVPARALGLRALMAELERTANHLGDVGAICNDAGFALMQAHCAILREEVLRAAHASFGHRLMTDLVVPGGVDADLDADVGARLAALAVGIRRRFDPLVELHDRTTSLQDRLVGTGILAPDLAARFGCGGVVGRASGRSRDARTDPGYAPYDTLGVRLARDETGDVAARVRVRIVEISESLRLIASLLDTLPKGPLRAALPAAESGEGMALIEGFRGEILAHVRIESGVIARAHLRDPSWFLWPVLERAIGGNIIADFPLCNKSFNCAYSGADL